MNTCRTMRSQDPPGSATRFLQGSILPHNTASCMHTNSPATDCEISLRIPSDMEGMRADRALAVLLPEYSRSTIQGWIRAGRVLAGGRPLKASERLSGSGTVEVSIPPPEPSEWLAEPMGLDIIHEDRHLFVINKPAGLVVHPGAGNPEGTLLNGLLALDGNLRLLPRAGIVHRLDKDTSGLMVVAKTESARQDLVKQLTDRSVSRHYLAVASGVPVSGATLDRPIGRHPADRRRMAVSDRGKPAITHVRIMQKYRAHSLVEARLETGRTHQIRVHLAWWGYPLVGDPVYGGRPRPPGGATPELSGILAEFRRQALHATALSLAHPENGRPLSWRQPPPGDFEELVNALARDHEAAPAR